MFDHILFGLVFAQQALATSQIALFSDSNCQDSLRGLEGPNGYPNGTCTDLRRNGPYGSLQVVGLDPGCTVTIYVNDTTLDICSGYQREIQLVDCYNSTYVYYSIDFCDAGAVASSSAAPTPSPSPSSSPSASPTPLPPASSGLSTGAIVGIVVGAVLGLTILGISVYYLVRRRRHKGEAPAGMVQAGNGGGNIGPAEMHGENAHELGSGAVGYKSTAVEIEQPPVELEGMDTERHSGGHRHEAAKV